MAAALVAASVAAPVLKAQPRLEKSRLTLAVGGKASFYYLPLTLALQLGYFRAEGLDVTLSDFAGGALALQALGAGSVDVVSGAYEHTISQHMRGRMLQSFVLHGRAPQIAVGVSTRAMPGFRSPSELRGKRIGVSSLGSSTQMLASLVLGRAGLPAAEVSYVGVGSSAGALAALRAGQIEAISNLEPVMTMLEHKGEVKIVSDTRTLKGTQEVFGGTMPSGCLYAPLEFVQQHPVACQALANAMVRALKWMRTAGPGDLIKTVPESYLLGDRGLYLAAFSKVSEAFSVDGLMPEGGPLTAFRALATLEPGLHAGRIDLQQTFTNEFARRAKERFRA
jgi:NitT/TauT family transport system substrate-binding protein